MSDDVRWEVLPELEVLVTPRGDVLVRNAEGVFGLPGLPPDLVRSVVAALSEPRTTPELRRLLLGEVSSEQLNALLHTFCDVLVRPVSAAHTAVSLADDTTPVKHGTVAVVGDGPLAAFVSRVLEVRHVSVARLPSPVLGSDAPGLLARRGVAVIRSRIEGPDVDGTDPEREGVIRPLSRAWLVVVASEGVPLRSSLDANAALRRTAVPGLFITADDAGVSVGPLVVPGGTACFECSSLHRLLGAGAADAELVQTVPFFSLGQLGDRPMGQVMRERVAMIVACEVRRLEAHAEPELANSMVHVGWDGVSTTESFSYEPLCGACATPLTGEPELRRRTAVATLIGASQAEAVRPRSRARPSDDAPRSVGILGGGTAGYLTALALRARLPHLNVTLIESASIPPIGVGEATTPRMVEFLHGLDGLGLDIVDFHERVRPVWKLGVSYEWGLPGDYAFPWPFQYGSLVEAVTYDGHLDDHCLGAALMKANRVPVFRDVDGSVFSALDRVPFAYHLDNGRFVTYLKDAALASGVTHVDAKVVDADLTPGPDGPEVSGLVTEDRRRLVFDLYVDCSGFRSFLLEQKLGSPFHSYATSLFTDAAVVANVPNHGRVKPYTVAETMDSGWNWNIAFEDSDHRGYVFSTAFANPDGVAEEMAATNPGMGEPWSLKFRSGRHREFWRGNVIALGNAYAFVEPLASTALHMLLYELDLFTKNFPSSRHAPAVCAGLNRTLGEMWDNLRGWLAVQYRFNGRKDTPFWRECRASVDLAGAKDRVALFRERAPLSSTSPVYRRTIDAFFLPNYSADYFSQDYVYDVMLTGMQIPANWVEPRLSRQDWARRKVQQQESVQWAMPAAEALRFTRDVRPDLLAALMSDASFIGAELF